jgi:hypothetical protein
MRRLVLAVAMIAAIGGGIAAYNVLTAPPAAACPIGSC